MSNRVKTSFGKNGEPSPIHQDFYQERLLELYSEVSVKSLRNGPQCSIHGCCSRERRPGPIWENLGSVWFTNTPTGYFLSNQRRVKPLTKEVRLSISGPTHNPDSKFSYFFVDSHAQYRNIPTNNSSAIEQMNGSGKWIIFSTRDGGKGPPQFLTWCYPKPYAQYYWNGTHRK